MEEEKKEVEEIQDEEMIEKEETQEQKRKKHERIQMIFLILLSLAIVALVIAIVVVVKNVEALQANPIAFGIEKYKLDSCICSQGGIFYDVDKDGFKNPVQEQQINLEEINLGAEGSDGYSEEE